MADKVAFFPTEDNDHRQTFQVPKIEVLTYISCM